ncbi:HB2L protein, partial [Sclerurus mexicanus]|nr:HB2L protein [Sclerurus mexicanus]
PSVSISLVPLNSAPCRISPLCRCGGFQDGQEPSEHVVATNVVPNRDRTHQLLVLLEIPPWQRVTYRCQEEHASLGHPLT